MPSAEIITIGTEILLGEIVDTNARHIARQLRAEGVDIYWTASVGDNPGRIAELVRAALARSEIVVTTGGLGPTVDDPTREAVAAALGVTTEFHPELWTEIQAMYRRFGRSPTANNQRQAYIPAGAIPVPNPVGTAPAFIGETATSAVICLPGVPREMEHLLEHAALPYIRRRFPGAGVIRVRVLHTAGVGESLIDERIADLEALANPTVGLAAHAGQVDLRIAAKAASNALADELIAPVEAELRRRLGGMIYGADGATLEDAALAACAGRGWRLAVVEAGLGGALVQRLMAASGAALAGLALASSPDPDGWPDLVDAFRRAHGAEAALGAALYPHAEPRAVDLRLFTPGGEAAERHTFGGHRRLDARRATHLALDYLRRLAAPDLDVNGH
jgi:competence/damage-inducible protein CinA-like protein